MGRIQLRCRVRYIRARHRGRQATAGERRQVRVHMSYGRAVKGLRFHGVRKTVSKVTVDQGIYVIVVGLVPVVLIAAVVFAK